MDDVVDIAIDKFISLNPNPFELGSVCGGKYMKVLARGDKTEAEGLVIAENGRTDMYLIVNDDLIIPDTHPQLLNRVDGANGKEQRGGRE